MWGRHYIISHRRANEDGTSTRFSRTGLLYFAVFVCILFSLFAYAGGYAREQRSKERWINSRGRMLVDTFNGQLILKPLNGNKIIKKTVFLEQPSEAGPFVKAELALVAE
jgi:hypothetical protein